MGWEEEEEAEIRSLKERGEEGGRGGLLVVSGRREVRRGRVWCAWRKVGNDS